MFSAQLSRLFALFLFCTASLCYEPLEAQNCSNLNFQLQASVHSTCGNMVMTSQRDIGGRPYLYVANKTVGLSILNISNLSSPIPVDTIPTILFDTLDVMNVHQEGNFLYLSLGNHFTNPQRGGMAIVDVSDPTKPALTDHYVVPASASGAGIVKVEGNYAYLGAMKSGIVILDISDKNNIKFVSQFVPDINYPVANPNADLYNARGMEVLNAIVYLCYDAGGLRIINCTDKLKPIETGRYANPATYVPLNRPRAYNNIILRDSLVYVSVDYCGLEILNIKDSSNISLTGWWNPYNCPTNNWFSSPSHTNELALDERCNQLFVSTGKSDMLVLDVADPSKPDSCNFYGGTLNNIGTWGVSRYQNQLYLAYICAIIPFQSNWTGLRILTYSQCPGSNVPPSSLSQTKIFPNPAKDVLYLDKLPMKNSSLEVINLLGECVSSHYLRNASHFEIAVDRLDPGIYFLRIHNGQESTIRKVLIQ